MRALALAAVLVAAAIEGCQLPPKFDVGYHAEPESGAPGSQASVLVLPFADARGPASAGSQAQIFLLWIPLWPYTSVVYERLDDLVIERGEKGGAVWSMALDRVKRVPDPESVRFKNSFPAAIARDLEASKVCARAQFSREAPSAGGFDYVLTGTIEHDEYRVTESAYGLSLAGTTLWMLAIPYAKVTGEVRLTLVLKDARTDAVVWTHRIAGEEAHYRNVYQASGMIHGTGLGAYAFQVQEGSDKDRLDPRSMFWWTFNALANAMEDARPDLARALAQGSPK